MMTKCEAIPVYLSWCLLFTHIKCSVHIHCSIIQESLVNGSHLIQIFFSSQYLNHKRIGLFKGFYVELSDRILPWYWANVVCSSSAVECQTRKRDSLGSNPLCYHFEAWAFLFSPRCPSSFGCRPIYEYLT